MHERRLLVAAGVVGVLVGILVGIGGYTFIYAEGFSYMRNDPAICANCHVMQDHYDAYAASSHKAVAVCNDCHTPHNLVGKYAVKALNGFNHSRAFTLGGYPDPLRITDLNKRVTNETCRHCHADMVAMIDRYDGEDKTDCLRCHSEVGHMQ